MKKYIDIITTSLLIIMIGLFSYQHTITNRYKKLYERELQNVEAYQISNSGLEGEIRQYKMTISDLMTSRDSLDRKLVATMQQLKIKEKNLQELQYQTTISTKIDTINCIDTIFVQDVHIDTTIGDKWYSLRLQMEHPSTIITTPTFNSEQYVYIYNTTEYKGGKSKIFFINWFKKKYTVTNIKMEERSPYINITNQKFIKVE